MDVSVINVKGKFRQIKELHSYKIIARMNDYHFKLVRAKREFIWHKHPETDEVFIVIKGQLRIDLRKKALDLKAGEMAVIPKGMEHKPSCIKECWVMLVEPAGTLNTGDAGGVLADSRQEWV